MEAVAIIPICGTIVIYKDFSTISYHEVPKRHEYGMFLQLCMLLLDVKA